MKHSLPSLLILLTTLLACNSKESQEVLEIEKTPADQITLIFQNPISHGFHISPITGKPSHGRTTKGDEIQFFNDQFIEKRKTIDFKAESDTVVISSKRDLVEIRLMYKGIDDLTYLFQNGDSVLFTYNGRKPMAQILNRSETYDVTNFSLVSRDSLAVDEYMAIDIVSKPMLLWNRINNDDDDFEVFKRKADMQIDTAAANLQSELVVQLDLLKKQLREKKVNNDHYKTRLLSLYMQHQGLTTYMDPEKESGYKTDAINSLNFLEKNYPEIAELRNDSLLNVFQYSSTFSRQMAKKTFKGLKPYEEDNGSAGFRIPNFAGAYDRIRVDSTITEFQRKILQYSYIKSMLREGKIFGIQTRLKYLTRFKNDIKDTLLVQQLEEEFNIKYEIDDEIQVDGINGESGTLKSVLAANSGKAVYIDYWASWCAPCIREMPSSQEMTKKYQDKDILFIYLSTDRNKSDWAKSIEKNSLNSGLHFRITNADNSKGLEDLNIPFIPRYMIYDRQGTLVNNDAPRPSEAELLALEFNKYLTDQK